MGGGRNRNIQKVRSRLSVCLYTVFFTATAALLGGNVKIGLLGGIRVVNAFVNGATDLVFIGSIKNFMTQSILSKPEVTKLQELKGKKIGVTRIGSNTHYFSVTSFAAPE